MNLSVDLLELEVIVIHLEGWQIDQSILCLALLMDEVLYIYSRILDFFFSGRGQKPNYVEKFPQHTRVLEGYYLIYNN